MRYLTIILFTIFLASCGKLSSIKYAGEKVKQSMNACRETTIDTSLPGTSVSDKDEPKEGIDTKISTVWDAHMMLW